MTGRNKDKLYEACSECGIFRWVRPGHPSECDKLKALVTELVDTCESNLCTMSSVAYELTKGVIARAKKEMG